MEGRLSTEVISYLVDATTIADQQMVGDVGPQLDMPGPALEQHSSPGDVHSAAHVVVPEGGRHEGNRISPIDDPQRGAHKGVEGPLELVVAHARTAKSDAPYICPGELNRCPGCP